ncbi:uncharacterized protein LOC108826384 [Raphanus sativus]|uniref:Uncharacterized protein LOC108826384 n=1 Tax=Raphanus sativus TaxID=3726 RepID=A0A9W3CGW1_RAPSA|nr:uncharacterized protein LOC108826384 [Raphanus sativus]
MNMEGANRTLLVARKKPKRKISKRLVRSIATYLKSDAYLYAPPFSDLSPLPPKIHTLPPCHSESSKAEDLPCADSRNPRSDIAEHTLHNGRISSSKRSLVILDGQRTEVSR